VTWNSDVDTRRQRGSGKSVMFTSRINRFSIVYASYDSKTTFLRTTRIFVTCHFNNLQRCKHPNIGRDIHYNEELPNRIGNTAVCLYRATRFKGLAKRA
jgi:hypothetical protein